MARPDKAVAVLPYIIERYNIPEITVNVKNKFITTYIYSIYDTGALT